MIIQPKESCGSRPCVKNAKIAVSRINERQYVTTTLLLISIDLAGPLPGFQAAPKESVSM
jgi:hypothetical protein